MSEAGEHMSDAALAALEARAQAATPGPWQWGANKTGHGAWLRSLTHMFPFVMQFKRWGFGNESWIPVFRDFAADVMRSAETWFVIPQRHNDWNVVDIDHPDAQFIAHARQDVPALLAEVRLLRAELPPGGYPDDIRAQGWMVAVHNDYRQDGKDYTFWLFTNGNRCAKGEGRTDTEALDRVREEIDRLNHDRGIGFVVLSRKPKVKVKGGGH